MAEILVIEDDDNKREQLCLFIRREFPQCVIQEARSLHSGILAVRHRAPALVLLDMTLPNYDPSPDDAGGQTHSFGGREFLKRLERYEIRLPVIVVTQFTTIGTGPQATSLDDLDRQLEVSFPGVYVGSVYYHAAIHSWKEKLLALARSFVQ